MSDQNTGAIDWGNPVSDDQLNRGLVSWWLAGLENPCWGGPKWLDLVPKGNGSGGNHGTLTNGPTWQGARGRKGGWGALNFDGSDDVVTVGSIPFLDNAAAFSVSLWFLRAGSVFSGARLIEKGANTEWGLDWTSSTAVEFFKAGVGAINATGLSADTWYHMTATDTGGVGGTISLYLNGVLVAGPSVMGNAGSTGSVYIGQYGGGAPYTHNGPLDDIRLFSRTLSAAEVYTLYEDSQQGSPRTLRRLPQRTWFVQVGGGGAGQRQLMLLGVGN